MYILVRSTIIVLSPVLFCVTSFFSIFFFNDPATTEIYTLSLHDALPISIGARNRDWWILVPEAVDRHLQRRSEEHTSELQSRFDLVCRLLLEKKKKKQNNNSTLQL